MKRKNAIIIIILIMCIGFAAVSTTLIINGNAKVSENADDFSVIFTAASLDGQDVYTNVIDDTKKIITFETSDLKTLNQTSVLNYEVTNNSSNYDAEVSINCKVKDNAEAKYTSIKNELEGNATVVKAKETLNGTLTVTLNKTATEEIEEEYVCELIFNAVERDELGSNHPIITKTGENIGDEVCIESECFYILDNEGDKFKLFAKYNLYIGNSYDGKNITALDNPTGLQSSEALGLQYNNGTAIYPAIGATAFSTKDNVYSTSLVKSYVEEYLQKFSSFNLDISNITAKLIEKTEIEKLINNGNSLSPGSFVNKVSNLTGKEWIYSTSYWTMTSYTSSNYSVWYMMSRGELNYDYQATDSRYNNNKYYGVRPVLVVDKDLIK